MKNLFSYQAVIFDLDGTLIDSAPSILGCFDLILRDAGIRPLLPLDNRLIGPPLRQTLVTLTGITDSAFLDRLVDGFKECYDTEGYKETRVYDGVDAMLAQLSERDITMAIATNKRRVPTLKIVEFLGWDSYFKNVGTLDMCSPPYPDKATLIGFLLTAMGLDGKASLYVGDKHEDGEAAKTNGMPFVAAGWGYGEWDEAYLPSGWTLLSSSSELAGIADASAFPTVFGESIDSEIESI